MNRYKIKNQIEGRYNQNEDADNAKLKVKNNQLRLKSIEQPVDHMWINSNVLLLPEVFAVVEKKNASSTSKSSITENENPIRLST